MSTTAAVATVGSRPELIGATYRRLQQIGFADREAANLTALINGFEISSQPWTVRELTQLVFVRELARTHRAWSSPSDRASIDVGGAWRLPGPMPRDPARPDGRITLQSLCRATSDRETPMPGHPPGASSDEGREGR